MSHRELDEHLHPVQIEILRNMSPCERLRLAGELSRATWNRAKEGYRRAHPEQSEAQVLKNFIGLLYGEALAAAVYPDVHEPSPRS